MPDFIDVLPRQRLGLVPATLLCVALLGCPDSPGPDTASPLPDPLDAHILAAPMKADVDYLADDASDGRIPGSVGHDQVADYLITRMTDLGLSPLGLDGGFAYPYPHVARQGHYWPTPDGAEQSGATQGRDLVGVLPGSDPLLADQYLVLMAHYDHLGVTADGAETYNGAYDDAAAVAALLAVAGAMIDTAQPLRHSVVFFFSDSEEAGLEGSSAWVSSPTAALDDVVAMLSVDPIGRGVLPDFAPLVVLGTEQSAPLQDAIAAASATYRPAQSPRAGVHFLPIEALSGFSSDQRPFLQAGVAAAWITSPGMSFYHSVDDTAETIDYRALRAQARWLAQVIVSLDAVDVPLRATPRPGWTVDDLRALRTLVDEALTSEVLDDREATVARNMRDQLTPAIDGDDVSLVDLETLRLAAQLYLFGLADAHPGPVPPPFPDDEAPAASQR